MNPQTRPRALRRAQRRRLRELAEQQGGLVSRRQLKRVGVSRWQIRAEIEAERWKSHGRHAVALHTGRLSQTAIWWRAVIETDGGAVLAGSSALEHAGLTGYSEVAVHVAVVKGARYHRPRGVVVHETRRLRSEHVVSSGLPREKPAPAAVHGSLWASSDRAGGLLFIMAVNQRIVSPDDLAESFAEVRRDKRRRYLRTVLQDVTDGVRSLGELDFARLCRQRGLPEPDRQEVCRGPKGRVYLDARWTRWSVTVEVDGIGHLLEAGWSDESLRHNEVAIDQGLVLRIPLPGLRDRPDEFLEQVEKALVRRGWRRGPAR